MNYHSPTELERGFLRVVTRGYSELAEQIESCEISDYDVVGFCYVNVLAGPLSPELSMAKGPVLDLAQIDRHLFEITNDLRMADPQACCIMVSLSTDRAGMLSEIEVVTVGDGYVIEPYRLFVDAAATGSPALSYPGHPERPNPAHQMLPRNTAPRTP
jgi:hypothetical protein